MAAAAVASASARQTLTPDEKRALFLAACDSLIESDRPWPPPEEVFQRLKGTKKEERKHLQSITLGTGDATIIAGYNQQYSSKGELERLQAVLKGENRSPRPTRQPSHATSMPRTEPADG